jgi:phage shock protein PspC (stress-responsive transcriptional regulator)
LKLGINARDAFYIVGLGGVCAGMAGEFGWTWAAIAGGAVLLITTVLAIRRD